MHARLWGPKIVGVATFTISGLPFGGPGTNHLNVGLVGNHRIYYKGEVGGFPQVQVVVNLVNLRLPVVSPNTKSASTKH